MAGQGGDLPALLVGGERFEWRSGASLKVGRDASSDVVVDGPRVSRVHLVIEATANGWLLRDAGSRNGTFKDGERISELVLDGAIDLRLGSPTDGSSLRVGVVRQASPAVPPPADARPAQPPEEATGQVSAARPGGEPPRAGEDAHSELGRLQTVHRPATARFSIGRSGDNDLPLEDDPRASRRHAELTRRGDGRVEITDLNSHNGTFVNGHRIHRAMLEESDVVGIGNHVFRFHNGALEEFAQSDEVSLDVSGLRVTVDGSTLLDFVAFSLPSRSMLAVVGPSGAGKTTLLRALTGFSRPTEGAVRFGGRDLYADYDELRARLGYVPQDDLVHETLTVRSELEFAGALRLPPDLGQAGIRRRAEEVMEELGLTARADLPIERISGGQRKRVSVGVELLTQPALLYLDEPTSGLDPGNERHVMQVLRKLADGGRIVVVVTHSTQSLEVADRVMFLARGGHMAYYGPPEAAQAFFERNGVTEGWPAVFQALEGDDGAMWAERFRRDPDFATYVGAIAGGAPVALPVPAHGVSSRVVAPVGGQRQALILCRRQLKLIAGDRRSMILLCAQAPVFALILILLFPSSTMSTSRGPFAALLEWLLVVSATWLGASNTIREIVKEQSIYRRERAAGLSLLAYVGSKVAVFGTITILQSAVLLILVLFNQHVPALDPTGIISTLNQAGFLHGLRPFTEGSVISSQAFEIFIAMSLAGLSGMAIGLFVSSAVRRSDQAVFMLPVVLVVEMALSQPILQLQTPSAIVTDLGDLTSANWAVNAVASSTSLNQLMTNYQLSLNRGTVQIKQLLGIPTPVSVQRQQLLQAIHGDPSWAHRPSTYLTAIFILLLMITVYLGGVVLMMRRLDTGNPRPLLQDIRDFAGGLQGARTPAPGGPGRPPNAGQFGPGQSGGPGHPAGAGVPAGTGAPPGAGPPGWQAPAGAQGPPGWQAPPGAQGPPAGYGQPPTGPPGS